MGESDNLYREKNLQMMQVEATANADLKQTDTELAYRYLNANFFNLEKESQKDKNEVAKWQKTHEDRKSKLEEAWHKNAQTDYKKLTKKVSNKSNKTQEYYKPFSLKQLETFIKHSDRGGNSDAYNLVATELELYNRISEKGNPLEAFGVLIRLRNNANAYVKEKSPNSSKGKIRKAIISEIAEKAAEKYQVQSSEYKTKAAELFEKVQEGDKTDEAVISAFKAQYDLIYQVLNGTIELTTEELANLDQNTLAILEMVMEQEVDETQANNMSTKFFNALGWSGNKPRIVSDVEFKENGKEHKKSPLKKLMYHTINPLDGKENAIEEGKQLAGVKKENNRIYYGLGRLGKGIYTSARADLKGATDAMAEKNSWGYGKKKGAVQLVMMLNEHARMMDYKKFKDNQEKTFDAKFRKCSAYIEKEKASKIGYSDYLSIKAAYFGYNTLVDYMTMINGVDYYVTTDRKALSISDEMRVRDEQMEQYIVYDTVEIKPYRKEDDETNV